MPIPLNQPVVALWRRRLDSVRENCRKLAVNWIEVWKSQKTKMKLTTGNEKRCRKIGPKAFDDSRICEKKMSSYNFFLLWMLLVTIAQSWVQPGHFPHRWPQKNHLIEFNSFKVNEKSSLWSFKMDRKKSSSFCFCRNFDESNRIFCLLATITFATTT